MPVFLEDCSATIRYINFYLFCSADIICSIYIRFVPIMHLECAPLYFRPQDVSLNIMIPQLLLWKCKNCIAFTLTLAFSFHEIIKYKKNIILNVCVCVPLSLIATRVGNISLFMSCRRSFFFFFKGNLLFVFGLIIMNMKKITIQ